MTPAPLLTVAVPGQRPALGAALRKQVADTVADAPDRFALAVQTSPGACLSYPLVSFLKATAILWLVEEPDGGIRNGLADPASGEYHHPAASPAVVLFGSVLHAEGDGLRLGDFTSRMLGAASLRTEHMGLTEPLHHGWDVEALTVVLREQSPKGVALVAGDGFSGTISAYRTDAGVVESFDVLLPAGLRSAELASALADAAVEANAQEVGLDTHHGILDGFVREGGELSRETRLRVLGPSLHRGVPIGLAPGVEASLRGHAPFQHLVLNASGLAG